MTILLMFLQLLLAFAFAPLFDGICRNLRTKIQSRRGYPIFQTYYDLLKLLSRGRTRPESGGLFFSLTPFLLFALSAAFLMLIPAAFNDIDHTSNLSNIFVIVYLLAAWRFVFGVASVSSGNPFAVVGASRESLIALYVEPAFIACLAICGFLASNSNLVEIKSQLLLGSFGYAQPSYALAAVVFLWACFVETGRKPFDLAEADQEVQEGVLAEYSGRDLALFETAMLLKQYGLLTLFVTLFVPFAFQNAALNLLFVTALVGLLWVGGILIDNFGPRFKIISSLKFKSFCMLSLTALALFFYIIGA